MDLYHRSRAPVQPVTLYLVSVGARQQDPVAPNWRNTRSDADRARERYAFLRDRRRSTTCRGRRVILDIYNSYTYVSGATVSEDKWLTHVLGAKRTVRGFGGVAKGLEELTFYDPVERRFPSGLCTLLGDMAKKAGVALRFQDKRIVPTEPKEVNLLFLQDDLRGPYQTQAIEAAVAFKRGILHCPTGFGKTQLAIGVSKRIPIKWAFLVDEASLLFQTMDRWNQWDFDEEPAGILGDGKWQDSRFVVATYQSVRARKDDPEIIEWVKSVQGVLGDEIHTVAAKEEFATFMRFVNAYFRIGLSATPLSRTPWDNLHVIGATGRVVYHANVPEMVAAGVLSMPYVTMVEFEHKPADSPTWQGVYGELIVKSAKRNNKIVELTQTCPKPAIVFVKQINHGEDLLNRLTKKGIKTELLYAEASLSERRAAVRRMMDGKIEVIVTNKIFQKGVDIPLLRTVIIAAGGKSVVDSLQRVGRGMRTAEGKDFLKVYDFMDRGNDWLLEHSRQRKRTYKDAGYIFEEETTLYLPFTTQ